MATLPHSSRHNGGGNALNLGVATLAAGALGFLVFAMPGDLFTDLVVRSRLPEYLAAAQPPLGMKARGAVIAAAAILTFLSVLSLLRSLDRLSARPARAARPERAEPDADAPRLRRADAHPDAPSRRPLLAGRDLGDFVEPDEIEVPDDETFADLPAQPLPGFLTEDRPAAREAPEEPVAEEEEPAAEEEEPAAEEELAAEEAETAAEEEEPLILDSPLEEKSVEALVSQLPEPEGVGDNSITSLMQRLESGLVEREILVDEPAESGGTEAVPEADSAPVVEQQDAPQTPSWLAPQPEAFEREEETETADPAEEARELVWPPARADNDAAASAVAFEERAEEPGAPPVRAEVPAAAPVVPFEEQGVEPDAPPMRAAFEAEAPAVPPEERAGEPVMPLLRAKGQAAAPPLPPVNEFGELIEPAHRPKPYALQSGPAPQPVAAPAPAAAPPAAAPPAAAEPLPPIAETQVGHRLRNALGELQRRAASGG